jgi:ribose transport system permease protein
VLALGVNNFGVKTLIQAAALTVGVALYTINWSAIRQRLQPSTAAISAT